MTAAHYAAVKALLADLPFTLYEGQVPDTPSFPYAVLFMDTGRGSDSRLSGRTARSVYDFQVNSVGLTDASARLVSDAVRARVLDARPSVTGFRCGLIDKVTSIPVRADKDITDPATGLHPMFAADSFSFESVPE